MDEQKSTPGPGEIIDLIALKRAMRSTDAEVDLRSRKSFELPAHVDYAKRVWLRALIDECDGNLVRVGRLWDRGSEKTLRKLIQSYGLTEALAAARARRSGR